MEALGVSKETYPSVVFPVLMGKLPESMTINMIRFSKNHMDWNLDDMLEAFQKEIEVLEGHFAIMQRAQQGDRRQEQQDRPPTASTLLTTRDVQMKCAFCKENNASEKCEKVKDPDEYYCRSKDSLEVDCLFGYGSFIWGKTIQGGRRTCGGKDQVGLGFIRTG